MEKMKILIVEDEVIIAEDLKGLVQNMGHEPAGLCVNAVDAVYKAKEIKPDLILMDILLLGKKTGIDAMREIREALDIPVIYITAYSDIKLLEQAQETEPVAYIVKPFDMDKLKACINLVLIKKMKENLLKDKIREMENEKDPVKVAVLEENVRKMKEQANSYKKELMILLKY